MLSMYVFSNGYTTQEVVNAVSAFMATSSFSKAMSIALIFSILGCSIQYIKTHDLMGLLKWFAVYFCVSFLLVGVKTDLNIVDLSNKMDPIVVDNVPYGIAMPASIITGIEAGLTEGIESVFHTPDDMTYSNTGMLFGAELFNQINNTAVILDGKTKAQFNAFLSQCIVPDILINQKYTFDDLAKSHNILAFLASKSMSPLRGIYINHQFTTCKAALPILTRAIEGNVTAQSSWLTKLLFGDKKLSSAQLFSKIQNVYSYMMGISSDAKSILYQNTMINAIREGLNTQFAKNSAGAAMVNFGYSAAMQKQLLADNTLSRVASYMIPIMHTIFILLVIATFPIVAMLAIQPLFFGKALKMYINSLVYLSMWPILFCIINFFMTTVLSQYMSAIAIAQHGITLANKNALLHEAEQFSAYCGYLIALVPILSGFLFKGLDAVFMHAAQTMVGNMQAWSSQTAMGVADGNIQLANTSIGNHSWNNWSANKHDTNYTNFSGQHTEQLTNAATVTHTASGADVYNTSGATSQLATSINAGSMVTSQISQSLDHAKQAVLQDTQNYTQSVNQSWHDLKSFSDSHGLNTTDGYNFSTGEQTSSTQAASNLMGIVHDVAQRNHISDAQAYQHLQGMSAHVGVEGGLSFGFPVKKAAGSIGGKIGVSGHYGRSNTYGTSHDNNGVISTSTNEQQQFNDNYNIIKNASQTHHTDQTHSQNLSGLSQISTDMRETDTLSHQLNSSISDSNRLSQMKSFAESNSSSISNNFSQAFEKYVQETHPIHTQSILTNTDNTQITEQRDALAEQFIKTHYMGQFEQQFTQVQSAIEKQALSENQTIAAQSAHMQSDFSKQKTTIEKNRQNAGIENPVNIEATKHDVNNRIDHASKKYLDDQTMNQDSQDALSSKVSSKMQKGEKLIKDKREWHLWPW